MAFVIPTTIIFATAMQTPKTETVKVQAHVTPELWLEEHGDMLYKFAMLRVSNSHVAEDLVQETLVNAFANHSKFRHESSIRTWLFRILKNEIHGYFRKRKTASINNDNSSDPGIAEPTLNQLLCPQTNNPEFSCAVERDEFWTIIQNCYEKIPEHLLETFLYRLANSSKKVDALCAELDISPSNFSVRLFRTRLMLRQCLEKSWLNEN